MMCTLDLGTQKYLECLSKYVGHDMDIVLFTFHVLLLIEWL